MEYCHECISAQADRQIRCVKNHHVANDRSEMSKKIMNTIVLNHHNLKSVSMQYIL